MTQITCRTSSLAGGPAVVELGPAVVEPGAAVVEPGPAVVELAGAGAGVLPHGSHSP